MGSTHNIYRGADYGFDPYFGEPVTEEPIAPYVTPSEIGLTTDARTANQLQEVSSKLNTGAKTIEVQMTSAQIAESIPNQHIKEINRLKKLAGAELTLHGPVLEPTGISDRGWNEAERLQVERQMSSAVERGHEMEPDGNIVVTLHASARLPELKTRVIEEVEGKPQEVIKEFWAVDEVEGGFAPIRLKENILTGEKPDIKTALNEKNKANWDKLLGQVSFHTHQGTEVIRHTLNAFKQLPLPQKIKAELDEKGLLELYKIAKTKEGQKLLGSFSPETRLEAEDALNNLNHGHVYIQQAYDDFQEMFNHAYKVAEKGGKKEDLERLNEYKKEVREKINELRKDPSKMIELSGEISKGLDILNSLSPPEILKPFQDFAIDKASDTFSNVAFNAYEKFRDKAPIISIENPPAGLGLSRAEDLKALIETTRKKFVEKAKQTGMSEEQAKREAEKLIGATWDVGHINMIRKFGYGKEALVKEAEKIAPFVKHIHLSDNFGFEHTELPMGMGNVPAKEIMELISKENKKAKKIVEAANWYEHFKSTPFRETLAAFGSPIYSMKMAPYWSKAIDMSGSYFAGYGINPDIHHSIYGAGFANLPVELGGQMQGKSRVSGAPIE